jgi:hypothetical protein
MAQKDDRRPRVAPRTGGDYDGSNSGANVVTFKPTRNPAALPFDRLTARLVMDRLAAGTLDPAIVAALLVAVGLPP